MYKLDIYEIEEGTGEWDIVETIEAETVKECLDLANDKYDTENYHWTNPY